MTHGGGLADAREPLALRLRAALIFCGREWMGRAMEAMGAPAQICLGGIVLCQPDRLSSAAWREATQSS